MRSDRIIKLLLALPLLGMMFGCKTEGTQLLLPVLGEKTFNGRDTVYHTVGSFSLVNQNGEPVTDKTLDGHIYIANFFFATCQSICPEMSTNLVDVQEAFKDADSVLIISHSVNPLHDTVEVLKAYAGSYGAISNKWHLLTGDKKQIYELAKSSYLVNALEDDGTPEGFLHSELFILVDAHKRLRGMYDGTDANEVKRLIEDVKVLRTEKQS